MAQKPDKSAAPAEPTPEQVADFLRAHPDFLNQRPDLLTVLEAPGRGDLGDGVQDFQAAMIRRLRRQMEDATEVAQELIDTSRENLTSQSRIHECVLALLSASSFERLIEAVQTDLPMLLDIDAVSLCVESENQNAFPVRSVTLVPRGFVDRHLGQGKGMMLREDASGDPEIFGGAAPLVRSDALVRLSVSDSAPPALLAFGSREAGKFHPGQATELVNFLTQVLSQLIRIWLGLPE